MRMRIGTANHRTFIFKDLYISNEVFCTQLSGLLSPSCDDVFYNRKFEFRQGQIVMGRETNHSTDSIFGNGNQQRVIRRVGLLNRIGHQGREVILEDKRAFIIRISYSTSALIPRTQIAIRIKSGQVFDVNLLHSPQPRAFGALRRNQNPVSGQRIELTMRRIKHLLAFLIALVLNLQGLDDRDSYCFERGYGTTPGFPSLLSVYMSISIMQFLNIFMWYFIWCANLHRKPDCLCIIFRHHRGFDRRFCILANCEYSMIF